MLTMGAMDESKVNEPAPKAVQARTKTRFTPNDPMSMGTYKFTSERIDQARDIIMAGDPSQYIQNDKAVAMMRATGMKPDESESQFAKHEGGEPSDDSDSLPGMPTPRVLTATVASLGTDNQLLDVDLVQYELRKLLKTVGIKKDAKMECVTDTIGIDTVSAVYSTTAKDWELYRKDYVCYPSNPNEIRRLNDIHVWAKNFMYDQTRRSKLPTDFVDCMKCPTPQTLDSVLVQVASD